MIKMKVHDGDRVGPIFVCDACGKELEASQGNAAWKCPENQKRGDVIDMHIVCKDCDSGDRFGDSWQELECFLFYLEHNSKFDKLRARRTINSLELLVF
jgi:hypothetical protein